jgi:ABC-type antimicrobial peptide transport system permease subunit
MSGDWTEELTFALRTDTAPEDVLSVVRREVGEVSRQLPIYKVSTLDAQYDAAMTPERLLALLSSFIGGFSLLLVGVGVYGTLAYAAARRTREMGVRLALGARRLDIARLLLTGALTPIVAGIAAGVPLALGAGYLIRSTLYGVSAGDLATYLLAAALLVAAGVSAAVGPAKQAAATDPMVALREE